MERPLYTARTVDLLRIKTELSKKYDTNISLAKIGNEFITVLVVDLEVCVVAEVGLLSTRELDILASKLVATIKLGVISDGVLTDVIQSIIYNFHNDLCIKNGTLDKLMMFWSAWDNAE